MVFNSDNPELMLVMKEDGNIEEDEVDTDA